MKVIYPIVTTVALLTCLSCNEAKRGNDSNLNEPRNEAAAEGNKDKFHGQQQRDAAFVYDVVAANYGEIKLAELANQKSRSDAIKQDAQMILQDHTLALNEAKTLAQAKAIEVPVAEKEDFHRKVENMAEVSAVDFDAQWVKEMIDLHEKDIDKFEDRLKNTQDTDLKAYINKTLPVLKRHYESLKHLRARMEEANS